MNYLLKQILFLMFIPQSTHTLIFQDNRYIFRQISLLISDIFKQTRIYSNDILIRLLVKFHDQSQSIFQHNITFFYRQHFKSFKLEPILFKYIACLFMDITNESTESLKSQICHSIISLLHPLFHNKAPTWRIQNKIIGMWIKFRNDHLLDSSLFKLGYATILVPNLTLKDRSIKKEKY